MRHVLVKGTFAMLLLAAGAAFPQSDKSEPSATFKTTTNLVMVQISATDKHGVPVINLHPDDLQIFEDGEKDPEKIAYFQPVTSLHAKRTALQSDAIHQPQATPQVSARQIPAILVMDALNTDPSDQIYAQNSMVKALNSLPPDTPVAVMRLDTTLWLLQDFTHDSRLLQDALGRAVSTASMTNLGAGALDKAPKMTQPKAASGTSQASAIDLQAVVGGLHSASEKEFQSGMMDRRVEQTLVALEAIARLVGHYRVRKNLIWVSGSFPLSVNADAEAGDNRVKFAGIRDYTEPTSRAANILADANVAIYPIDARGLQAPAMYSASQGTAQRKADSEFVDRVDTQATMSLLASETGGRTCVDTNNLGGCLTTALADGSSYYEIGYYPRNRNWDGKFRGIKIRTTLRNVQLRYRHGYFAESHKTEKPVRPHLQVFRDERGRMGALNWSQDSIEYKSQGLPIEDAARGFFNSAWGRDYHCTNGKLIPRDAKSEPTHQFYFTNLRGDTTIVELLGKEGVEYHGTLSIDESVIPFFQIVRIFYRCQ